MLSAWLAALFVTVPLAVSLTLVSVPLAVVTSVALEYTDEGDGGLWANEVFFTTIGSLTSASLACLPALAGVSPFSCADESVAFLPFPLAGASPCSFFAPPAFAFGSAFALPLAFFSAGAESLASASFFEAP